jgi:hypothetical protein
MKMPLQLCLPIKGFYVITGCDRAHAGIARDGYTLMAVRMGEPLTEDRYLTQEEMKLKISDFAPDTVFILSGKP